MAVIKPIKRKKKGKVVVAMSGGVDSSVTAAILQIQGYDVIGMGIQTFDNSKEDKDRFDSCCSISDLDDARRVCETLGVPFYTVNGVNAFEAKVIDYFVSEYLQARTPNPCIVCNNLIKFDFLLERAEELGAEVIATGHYAKVSFNEATERYFIAAANDKKKDQSYYLFGLTQEQLSKTIMPLGDFNKMQVRKLAEEYGLDRVSKKPDSQEICFIGKEGYADFIEKRVAPSLLVQGAYVGPDGATVGSHEGLHRFTIGQKKGLDTGATQLVQKTPDFEGDVYVTGIDLQEKDVFIGSEKELMHKKFVVERFNWMCGELFATDRTVTARIRSRHEPSPVTVRSFAGNELELEFEKPQRAITPGQAVVLYRNEEVLGGGWIKEVLKDNRVIRQK